mmetsp:Transcript_29553/g.74328  ORF Transcript_29553/g.74328 Transcript_29553/m.74328 type:complete len:157 (+) Transcript_29553:35-505(+)
MAGGSFPLRPLLGLAALLAVCPSVLGTPLHGPSRFPPAPPDAHKHPERSLSEMRRTCEKVPECSEHGTTYDARHRVCVYKCMSEECYQEVYGADELEDGEVDSERYLSFGQCMRKDMKRKHSEEKMLERKVLEARAGQFVGHNGHMGGRILRKSPE